MTDDRERLDLLGRYWDELAQGEAGARLAPAGHDGFDDFDPTLLEALQRFHELGTTPPPGSARDRVWRELRAQMDIDRREQETPVQAIATLAQPRIAPIAPISNGRSDPRHRRPSSQSTPIPLRRRVGSIFSLAAAAVLLLTMAAGLIAIRFGAPGSGNGHLGSIPAAQVSPEALEATPPAGPVEFLWETSGDPASPLGNPAHIAVAPDGNIWVADGDHNRFQIFAPDGSFLEAWGTAGAGDGEFDFSVRGWAGHDYGAVAFAPDGTIYVADPGNHRIQKFDADRAFLFAWGSEGAEPGQFILPMDLVVDGQGRVYVADADSDVAPAGPSPYIQVFDADGTFLAEWGVRGSEPGQMNTPFGIGLDPADGTLLIAEFNGSRVQRFTPEGEVLEGWGGGGSLDGKFNWAMDAAVDAAGRVYVTDYSNNRVQVFDRDGRFLAAWGEFGVGPGQFASALGVAVGADGTIYVTDAGKRLQAFRVGDLPAPAADEAAQVSPEATPSSDGVPLSTLVIPAAYLPAGEIRIRNWDYTQAPGTTQTSTDNPWVVSIEVVLTGSYGVTSAGPRLIWRGGTDAQPEEIAAGAEGIVGPGDVIVYLDNSPQTARVIGDDRVRAFDFGFFVIGRDAGIGATGDATVALRRVTLAPGEALPPARGEVPIERFVEEGVLTWEVTRAGETTPQPSRTTPGRVPFSLLLPGTTVVVRNDGDEPLVFLEAAITLPAVADTTAMGTPTGS